MGQARNRRAEIETLKSKPKFQVDVEFLAIRHLRDGTREFAHARIGFESNRLSDKGALLSLICRGDWLHNPPVDRIAEYLVQTNSYKMVTEFMSEQRDGLGFIINFFESDPERPETYSCRFIHTMPTESLRAQAQEMAAELADDPEYSVIIDNLA